MTSTQDGIDRFRRPEYRRLLAAARRSLEHTGGDLGRSVAVASPNEAERKAIISVTGHYRPPVAGRVPVRLTDLDEAAREATGLTLRDLLARLAAPPANQHAGPTEDMAVAAVIRWAECSSLMSSAAWYASWLDSVRGGVAAWRPHELEQAVRVLEYLTSRAGDRAPVMLGTVAEAVTGDAGALSDGTALSALVMGALAARGGEAAPRSAAGGRWLWDSADVVADDLASRVLVLNLAADGTGLGEWLTGAARFGTPFYVTLHQLAAHPPRIHPGTVYACQHRAVFRRAAADLAVASAPLLCAEGRPSAAFRRLAEIIAMGGGELRYHGDFDWLGVTVAATLIDRYQATAWRMTATDYLAGAGSLATGGLATGGLATGGLAGAGQALTGTPRPTPWDPGLATAMRQTGLAVPEENVTDQLIGDLRRGD